MVGSVIQFVNPINTWIPPRLEDQQEAIPQNINASQATWASEQKCRSLNHPTTIHKLFPMQEQYEKLIKLLKNQAMLDIGNKANQERGSVTKPQSVSNLSGMITNEHLSLSTINHLKLNSLNKACVLYSADYRSHV